MSSSVMGAPHKASKVMVLLYIAAYLLPLFDSSLGRTKAHCSLLTESNLQVITVIVTKLKTNLCGISVNSPSNVTVYASSPVDIATYKSRFTAIKLVLD